MSRDPDRDDQQRPKFKDDDDEFETRDFVELEGDFQAVLREIGGDKQLEHFRVEYEKLHRALKLSHDNEKKLIKKCKELNSDITESTLKVQQALRLSQEESENIRHFKADLDRAMKTIESFKEKEKKAKDTIQDLRAQIEQLGKIVEQGSGLSVGQDSTVNELIRTKEELTKEVAIASEQITNAQQHHNELSDTINRLENTRITHDTEINNLKEQIQRAKKNLEDEDRRKRDLEKQLDEEKKLFEDARKRTEERDGMIRSENETRNELLKQLRLAEEEKKENAFKLDEAEKRLKEAHNSLGKQEEMSQNIMRETSQYKSKVEKHRQELQMLETEQRQLKKDLSSENKRNANLIEEKHQVENIRERAREYVQMLIRESDQLRKNTESDRKAIDNLKRERDIIMKTVIKARENVRVQEDQIVTQTNNAKKIKNEITGYTKENSRMTKLVWQLQAEKEKYGIEKSQAYAKYRQCLEEVKLCNSVIAELQKKSVEVESKLKQQQNLYDSVRADRNLYSKNLMESHTEIEELEQRKKIMLHEIDKLKDEITNKNIEVIREEKRIAELKTAENDLKSAKRKYKKKREKLEEIISKSESEIQNLKYVISEVEQEKLKQKKELELVTNERDILSTQLIRRKEELDLLYEKIGIYNSTLKKGERQYKERQGDIYILKLEISELKEKLNSVKREAAMVFDLKKEKYHLERETLDEKVKVKALSEEVENTMNVHRWRKLEGTDPETYELITKVHTLQRRLIGKSEEVVKKTTELEAMEKSYNNLKISLARHPGPESGEQLELCRKTLDEKKKQMMNMEQELNIIRAQESEYRYEIDRLEKELQEVKLNYFDLKKKERLRREKIAKLEGRDKPQIMRHPPPQRFTGGGFNLAV